MSRTADLSPQSTWGSPPAVLELLSMQDFESVVKTAQEVILKTYRLHPYNTLDTFVEFHRAFRARPRKEQSLEEFNDSYPVVYQDRSLSCVGLSLRTKEYLAEEDQRLGDHIFLVCGDEYPLHIQDPRHQNPPSPEEARIKDHILLALEFDLIGRRGYLVIDVGLALDFPVVVMRDGLSPHTGLFKQLARTGHREYRMDMTHSDSAYLIWSIRECRDDDKPKDRKRYLHVGRPYLNPDHLERRNRVYPYHAYCLMGVGGIRTALYLVLGKDDRKFTVFLPDDTGKMVSAQFTYDYFTSSPSESDLAEADEVLEKFSKMCGFGGREEIFSKFKPLSEMCGDHEFINLVLEVHQRYIEKLHSCMITK